MRTLAQRNQHLGLGTMQNFDFQRHGGDDAFVEGF
jgi:hypothetical protein